MSKEVKRPIQRLAKEQRDWDLTLTDHGDHFTADREIISLILMRAILDELVAIRGHMAAMEGLARCPNVKKGFIAMNKMRLHLEKALPAPKTRARKA